MSDPLDTLTRLMSPAPLSSDRFQGQSQDLGLPQLFGGQVLGQALYAAQDSVNDDRIAHSLHSYFISAGDPHLPVDYAVESLRDGGSFSTRRVVATQSDTTLFICSASFQRTESGLSHQNDHEALTMPEDLIDAGAEVTRYPGQHPIEFLNVPTTEPTRHQHWFRLNGHTRLTPVLSQVLLAYCSDFYLLATSLKPHDRDFRDRDLQIASLDHALWFHEHADPTDWLLFDMTTSWTGGGRGLCQGVIYNRDGSRVATVMQEGLIRVKSAS
ncbi:acyl-CoA thioesterase [Larsenimonas suaedae]|uniref:Acyl-CoA thioesterase II n=1 Tax=Larsenimonas suaedae TaxID=1851019 RepID=A0ABU1GU07_9GAMM|nr:acyl-CoA thioesterase II [Larsenimonas suaedae]MCM2971912.1 acyl-CoA thioesterase II [Larsenimonas suaedae]MDR5895464.1 acyl-CoA thioesterase II [Larsenimonas suaedae]